MKLFWEKVEKTERCWLWKAARSKEYGHFKFGDKITNAHRVAYELEIGPIPPGHHIHHKCENPLCVNPDHLQPVTPGEHVRDLTPTSVSYRCARVQQCPQGHPYNDNNTYVTAEGYRRCRVCNAQKQREVTVRRRQQIENSPKQPNPKPQLGKGYYFVRGGAWKVDFRHKGKRYHGSQFKDEAKAALQAQEMYAALEGH